MTYILVDTMNLMFRARHVVRGDDIETKIAMSYHIIFSSINKVWRDFKGTNVITCFEGRSWRKAADPAYKANRSAARDALTPAQAEEDAQFFEAFSALNKWLAEKTNVTVLQHKQCEADDFIARWIQTHPNDEHIIVSSDSDFYQLLAPNVKQYNGITKQLITIEGIFDDKNKPVKDKKTKLPLPAPDPEWLLFEKCMRGDSSDNVFSAYPGVRTKGSKNKVGLIEAFSDRNTQGYNWNNLLLQRWVDHEGVEHRVRDKYLHNKMLIDLTQQPAEIKAAMDETIKAAISAPRVSQVGLHLMKFCGKYGLEKIAEQADMHSQWLNSSYNGSFESPSE